MKETSWRGFRPPRKAGRLDRPQPLRAHLFLLFDAVSHIVMPTPVAEAFARLGLVPSIGPVLGVLMLVLIALYVVRRTTVLGAVLLTGYLGRAIATQLSARSGAFELPFPILFGVLVLAPPYLTEARTRGLF